MHRREGVIKPHYRIANRHDLVNHLTLRTKNGGLHNYSYGQFHAAHSIDGRLELEFTRHQITIQGNNLDPLQWAISSGKLSYLRETTTADEVEEGEPVVREICLVGGGSKLPGD